MCEACSLEWAAIEASHEARVKRLGRLILANGLVSLSADWRLRAERHLTACIDANEESQALSQVAHSLLTPRHG